MSQMKESCDYEKLKMTDVSSCFKHNVPINICDLIGQSSVVNYDNRLSGSS